MVSGQIYKLSTADGKCFIGMTTIPISFRIANYQSEFRKYKEGLPCKQNAAFELMEYGELQLEILEDIDADDIKEVRRRQGWWVRNTPNCINKTIPGRTDEEYYQDNKKALSLRHKEKYQKNRDVMLQRCKSYQARKRAEQKNGLVDVTTLVSNMIPLMGDDTKKQSQLINTFFNTYMK